MAQNESRCLIIRADGNQCEGCAGHEGPHTAPRALAANTYHPVACRCALCAPNRCEFCQAEGLDPCDTRRHMTTAPSWAAFVARSSRIEIARRALS